MSRRKANRAQQIQRLAGTISGSDREILLLRVAGDPAAEQALARLLERLDELEHANDDALALRPRAG